LQTLLEARSLERDEYKLQLEETQRYKAVPQQEVVKQLSKDMSSKLTPEQVLDLMNASLVELVGV